MKSIKYLLILLADLAENYGVSPRTLGGHRSRRGDHSEVRARLGSAAAAVGAILGMPPFATAPLALQPVPLSVFSPFATQANADPSEKFSFGSLYAYHPSLWGFLGLALLQILIGFVAITAGSLVSVILFFLLGLPLFLVYAAWACFSACSYFAFFDAPEAGAIKSLSRAWSLVTKDWQRWAAMSVLILGAGVAMKAVKWLLQLTIEFIPFAGPIASTAVSGLLISYLAFVLCSCYRDSSASLK